MTVTTTHHLPMILTEVQARSVHRISPTFVRVELVSPALADFGVEGPLYDQRVKLVFPNAAGELPSFEGADESWFSSWLDIPADERGHMRTYTVREMRGSGEDTALVVDFVLHVEDGESGPGSSWAATARPGDRLVLLGPRRGEPFGGIEFDPGAARNLLLAGDETAVPAICSILADLDVDARGTAFLEVPCTGDVMEVPAPDGVEVVWLPRDGADHGARQIAAVRKHLGLAPTVQLVDDQLVEPDLWETPTYSSSGEEISPSVTGRDLPGLYAWIAGESKVVTSLRRCLVSELGVDRAQVAFMGYWRRGVAMRS
ncbi:MAG TPA: siderophore-interacting protein [Nocardioidaceae bacterium]|nr:siderophore-interacting protein [Nocardioidaceae bacterium]